MAFPLATVLAAAPGIISAAADVIKLVRNRKQPDEASQAKDERVDELAGLLEKQALLIEELARTNNQLALAVRNNRIIALVSLLVAMITLVLVFWQ